MSTGNLEIISPGGIIAVGGPVSEIPGFLTTAEVAARLKYTARRVRQLAAELRGVQVGRDWLYPADAVDAYAKKPRPKPGRKPGQPQPKKRKKK
jgi:excisionase family DNA binding protein